MPSIRIKNASPNIISKNTLPRTKVRNTLPNITAKNDVVHIKILSGGSTTTTIISSAKTFGGKGYLMGMLALTYTAQQSVPAVTTTTVSNFKPNLRIQNV